EHGASAALLAETEGVHARGEVLEQRFALGVRDLALSARAAQHEHAALGRVRFGAVLDARAHERRALRVEDVHQHLTAPRETQLVLGTLAARQGDALQLARRVALGARADLDRLALVAGDLGPALGVGAGAAALAEVERLEPLVLVDRDRAPHLHPVALRLLDA